MKRIALAAAFVFAGASWAAGYPLAAYLDCQGNGGASWLDVDSVVFRNASTGAGQLWRLDEPGGVARQLTSFPDGVDRGVGLPDGRVLVFADNRGDERIQLYVVNGDGSALAPLTSEPTAAFEYGDASADGHLIAVASNRRDERFFDVYTMDLRTGELAPAMVQDGYNLAAALSPDGSRLVAWRARGALDGDLYLVDLATKESRLLTPHEGPAEYGAVAWAADGGGFYFTSNQGRDYLSLAYYDLANGEIKWVATPPWDVEALAPSPDGRFLLWLTNEDGASVFHLLDLKERRDLPVPALGPGVASEPRWSPDGERVLFSWQSPAAPADVYDFRAGETTVRRWTYAALGTLSHDAFATPTFVAYPSFDGTMVPAFLYLPAEAPARATPCVVMVHGGPAVQARPTFDAVTQYFVNAGWAVFVPNVRGSTGWGRVYADADNLGKRTDAVWDLRQGWEWLAAQPWCDPRRIGIMGASYGGYMVLAALVADPYRWAAGVDIRGISNFVSYMENTGPWRLELREDEYGSLARDRDLLVQLSPMTHIQNLRAPLMVIHGANDVRVPLEQAEQVVAAARIIIGDENVEFVVYADEGHGLSKRQNQLDAYPKIVAFLERAFAAREKALPPP